MSRTLLRTITLWAALVISTVFDRVSASEYVCTMSTRHPFNVSDPSQEFVVDCTVEFQWEIYAWIGGVLGGLVLLYILIAACFEI